MQPCTPQDLTFLRTSVSTCPYAHYRGPQWPHVRHWYHTCPSRAIGRPYQPSRASRSAQHAAKAATDHRRSRTRSAAGGANSNAPAAPTTRCAASTARGRWRAASSRVWAAPIEEMSSSKLPARTHKRSRLFDADPVKMPCRTGKRRKRRKSSFEHKPWKLQNGVKVTNVLYF